MSKVGVNLKIDVSKIDKARLFQGQKGTYLDAQVFIDLAEFDQYGNNGMITQAVSKEEKDQGVKGAILGNCKIFWSDSGQMPQGGPVAAPQGFAQNQGFAPQSPQQSPQAPQLSQAQQRPQAFNQQQAQPQGQQQPTQAFDQSFDQDIPF